MNMQKEFLKNVLTVDCGLHTGWAYWDGTNRPIFGSFKCLKAVNHFEQRNKLVDAFSSLLTNFNVYVPLDTVYLEGTMSYGSVISQTGIRKGTLFELSYLVK